MVELSLGSIIGCSDEQAVAVLASKNRETTWKLWEKPEDFTGKVLPFVKKVTVNWDFHHSGMPSVYFHYPDDPHPEFIWEEVQRGFYLGYNAEYNLYSFHKHTGIIKDRPEMVVPGYETKEDGTPNYSKPLPKVEQIRPNCTEKQEGYGGRSFYLKMKDGRTIELRGPWHVSPPKGFHAFYGKEYPIKPHSGGWFGWICREEDYIATIKHFLGNLDIIWASHYGGNLEGYEPALKQWQGKPRRVMEEIARAKYHQGPRPWNYNVYDKANWMEIYGTTDTVYEGGI